MQVLLLAKWGLSVGHTQDLDVWFQTVPFNVQLTHSNKVVFHIVLQETHVLFWSKYGESVGHKQVLDWDSY